MRPVLLRHAFTKAYEEFGALLNEGAVVEITGNIVAEQIDKGDDEDPETILKLYVKSVEIANKKTRTIMITLNLITDWEEVYSNVEQYLDSSANACKIIVWDKAANELRETDITVSDRILTDSSINTKEI